MLVLSRRVGQQIRIGKSVVVTLLKVERHKARIGIEAPPSIAVYRQELLEFESRPTANLGSPAAGQSSSYDEPRSSRPPLPRVAARRFLWDDAAV